MKTIIIFSILLAIALLITIAVLVIANRIGKRNEVVDPEAKKEIERLKKMWEMSE